MEADISPGRGKIRHSEKTDRQVLKIITINTNGIRSAVNKGFHLWLAKQDADIVCIQELKAQPDEVPDEINLDGTFYRYVHCAEKKGYSGCAILTRKKPDEVIIGFGNEEFDREGRYVEARFNNLIVVSIYFPSGRSSEERQQAKFRFLDVIKGRLDELLRDGRDVVLCGDFNIAHKEIDIKNWKGNLKNSGFLPEERQWITDRLREGWQDVFRRLDPRPDRFTWWSNRGRARINNVGWRIDYQFSTPAIASTAKETDIYRDERFSDHAPLTVVYDFNLQ